MVSRPLKDKISLNTALAFDGNQTVLPALPETVISDNGTEFIGKPFRELLQCYI